MNARESLVEGAPFQRGRINICAVEFLGVGFSRESVLTLTVLEVLGKLAAGRISTRPTSPLLFFLLVVFFFFPLSAPSPPLLSFLASYLFISRERGFCRVLKALWQREFSCRSPRVVVFDAVLWGWQKATVSMSVRTPS